MCGVYPSLDVRIWRLYDFYGRQILTSKVDPRAVRFKKFLMALNP